MEIRINASQLSELLVDIGGVGKADQIGLALANSNIDLWKWIFSKGSETSTSGSVTPTTPPKPPVGPPGRLPLIYDVACREIFSSLEGFASNSRGAANQLDEFFQSCISQERMYKPSASPPLDPDAATLRPVDLIAAGIAFHHYAESNPRHPLNQTLVEMSNRLIETGAERLSSNHRNG